MDRIKSRLWLDFEFLQKMAKIGKTFTFVNLMHWQNPTMKIFMAFSLAAIHQTH